LPAKRGDKGGENVVLCAVELKKYTKQPKREQVLRGDWYFVIPKGSAA